MIKNERQYRITKSQVEKFDSALSELVMSQQLSELHPLLQKAQHDALRSQRDDLRAQIEEYDALRSGKRKVLEVTSFSDLPRALIQARIAAGLSHKQLADRLNLKEQQIQLYESTDYAGASFTRIQEIIQALGIHIVESVFLPSADITKDKLFQRIQSVGIDRKLILERVLPRPLAARLRTDHPTDGELLGGTILQAASIVGHVFGIQPSSIFDTVPLHLNTTAVGYARFKLPANVNEQRVSAYAVYAHFLALIALEVTRHLEPKVVPTDAKVVHQEIISIYGSLTFENALKYVWSLGIPVLPLADPAAFHGACWRVQGRNVIVLKQQARYVARWLHDLLHELFHASEEPDQLERAVLELQDILEGGNTSEEEEDAQYFAEDIIFDGRADELAKLCVKRAQGDTARLKSAVPIVAAQANVSTDALAYHMAYRLSGQNQNWWGPATNLQNKELDPVNIARKLFLENANLSVINEVDRTLLLQAMSDVG